MFSKCLCLCLCLCLEVDSGQWVSWARDISALMHDHGELTTCNHLFHSSWKFVRLCLCICLCLCNCHHGMIEDIVPFTAIFHMRGLAWSLDDLKGFRCDLYFWRGRTDERTNERTKVFQEVLADLKRAQYIEHICSWESRYYESALLIDNMDWS